MEYIAHRGLSGLAPENTAFAFKLAAERGFHWCELDVNVTTDDVPVVWHDDDLTPFGHRRLVSRSTVSDLAELDMGSWFAPSFSDQRLMTLHQTLDYIQSLGMAVNVELKPELAHRLSDSFSLQLLDCFQEFKNKGLTLLLSSFHPQLVNWGYQFCPDIPRAVLVEGPVMPAHRQLAELTHASALHLEDKHVTPQDLQSLQKAGWPVRVYTVNDADRAQWLAARGCVGIFTDYLLPEGSG